MADSTKTRVVIASVLKPVDDSRMYEKIGLTLARSEKYEVHVIGCASAKTGEPNLIQHGFRHFPRVSLGRLLAPTRIFSKTFRIRPGIVIITTHELLYAALLLKLIIKCRIVYDVQENYYWNILYTPAFPALFKPFIAFYVRGKETLAARYVDHFLLAERGYELELKFPRGKYTIIENKVRIAPEYVRTPIANASRDTINLIFSGTLAETTGIFTAIELAIKLHVMDDRIRFTIIGFCSQRRVMEKIRLLIHPRPFIKLLARDSPVPHTEIFKQIAQSDFGLITYQINPSTMNSIPTKMYEYLGFKLPILLVDHKPWVDYCLPYSAAIVFDPSHIDAAAIYRQMLEKSFYTMDPVSVYWSAEEPKLLQAIDRLI